MDHDTIREQLELAAAEPGGLERLMAGDTPAAQAVAAHLAGCPACTDELARLERSATLIRGVVRATAPADLRERTLAAIRTAGVPRGSGSTTSARHAAAEPSALVARSAGARSGRFARGWFAAIAAAVVLSVVATSLIVGSRVDQRLAVQAETVEALQEVAIATLQITGEPDARRVALAGGTAGLEGDLIFSPRTSELVVVATGLTPPPPGREYRCWVEEAGQRERVGKMFFSDDLAYWIGPAPAVAGLVSGATFGVSLVDADGSATDTEPILRGSL
jgi:anti-sigma-K factor RskA